MKDTNRTLITQ